MPPFRVIRKYVAYWSTELLWRAFAAFGYGCAPVGIAYAFTENLRLSIAIGVVSGILIVWGIMKAEEGHQRQLKRMRDERDARRDAERKVEMRKLGLR